MSSPFTRVRPRALPLSAVIAALSVFALLASAAEAQAAPITTDGVDHPVSGTAEGRLALVIIPNTKTCTSPPVNDSDDLCQYSLRGTYTEGGYLGDGKIGGRLVLDSRTYQFNVTYGLNCYSNVMGVVKFVNSQGTLRTKIKKSDSVVCDQLVGTDKDAHLTLLGMPGGNVGGYTNVTGGSIAWEGTWTQTGDTTFSHSDTFDGSIQTSS